MFGTTKTIDVPVVTKKTKEWLKQIVDQYNEVKAALEQPCLKHRRDVLKRTKRDLETVLRVVTELGGEPGEIPYGWPCGFLEETKVYEEPAKGKVFIGHVPGHVLETYKRALQFYPQQKAIIASGFSESKNVKEAQKLGAGPYVRKPYLLKNIGLAVKVELDK